MSYFPRLSRYLGGRLSLIVLQANQIDPLPETTSIAQIREILWFFDVLRDTCVSRFRGRSTSCASRNDEASIRSTSPRSTTIDDKVTSEPHREPKSTGAVGVRCSRFPFDYGRLIDQAAMKLMRYVPEISRVVVYSQSEAADRWTCNRLCWES